MDTHITMISIPMDIFSAFFLALMLAFAWGAFGKVKTQKRHNQTHSGHSHLSKGKHSDYSVMVTPTDLFDEEVSRKRKALKKSA